MGGKARAEKPGVARKKEIAANAAAVRWEKTKASKKTAPRKETPEEKPAKPVKKRPRLSGSQTED